MRYIIYLRVSTKEQDLRTQEQKVLRVLKEKYGQDIEYIIFTDSKSSKLPLNKRKGMWEALKSLREGDILVGVKVDRLARSEPEAHEIKDFLIENKNGIIMIDQPGVEDPFVFAIYVAVAAQEVKFMRARIKDKLHEKQVRNERTGNVRYGFDLDQKNLVLVNGRDKAKILKPGYLLENDKEQECLNKMFKFFDEGHSYRQVAKMINYLGYTTRKGKPWDHATVYRILIRTGRTRFLPKPLQSEEDAWTRRQRLKSSVQDDKVSRKHLVKPSDLHQTKSRQCNQGRV